MFEISWLRDYDSLFMITGFSPYGSVIHPPYLFFIRFIRNSFFFQLILACNASFCTKHFLMCNIVVPLRPLTIKKDLDEKN